MNLYENNHYLLKSDEQILTKLREVMVQKKIINFDDLLEKAISRNIYSLSDLWNFMCSSECDEDLGICLRSLFYRIKRLHNEKIETFSSSTQLGYYLQDKFCGSEQEKVYALFLDSKNKVIAEKMICEGTLNRSIIHPRDIFRRAVVYNCASFVLAHNHPSGDADPSKQDLDFTAKLKQASRMMGIDFLDHFIVSDTDYFSFREAELL
ncbi:DNA repair protein RadC [Lactobacillus sp.]|uniref:JAB domain-containing protein n=1 Tax=Lactobacillus sp. TaxID=1591 RepID=UPI0019AFBAAC|nr:DNA repair protein RadC [Lactobacillus sp.]MBD5430042.1 DNA repair protein RadC [Lactobacillus sp.]